MMGANYTVYLKELINNDTVKPLIDEAMSTYPMCTPDNTPKYFIIPTREELNKKILDYYSYHQIGFETVGRFLDELKIAMNEIMPYYYQLYKTADIINGIDDPFGNVDVTETFEQQTTGSKSDTSSSNLSANSSSESNSTAESSSETDTTNTSNNRNVKSDTPQSKISDIGATIGNSNVYASEVGFNDDTSSSNATNTGSDTTNSTNTTESSQEATTEATEETEGTVRHTLTKVGNQGVSTYAHDMLEFRELIMNIEQNIINDKRLTELFMMVY